MISDDPESLQRDYLLSYPRSGNHWVRFIIEYITAKPTHGCIANEKDPPIHANCFPQDEKPLKHVDSSSSYVIWKAHTLDELRGTARLVFIIRDFKECIPRHTSYDMDQFETCFKEYLDLLQFYDSHQKPKLLIYYEELLASCVDTAIKLAALLPDVRRDLVAEFANNADRYKRINTLATGRRWAGCVSDFQPVYHYRLLSDDQRRLLHSTAKRVFENYPAHLNKYLKSYWDPRFS